MVGYGSRDKEMKASPVRTWRCPGASVCRRIEPELLVIVLFLTTTVVAQVQHQNLVFNKDLSFSDLPAGVEKRIFPGTSTSQLHEMLMGQPSIVIDGATLTITPPAIGPSRSIAVKSIELRNGGRIVTNGVSLEIDALLISSDRGQIVSFDEPVRHVAGQAAAGNSGRSGLSAATLVLSGALGGGDVLVVSLYGQDGQKGGDGLSGPGGAPGPHGDNAADHAFDCAHGGGNGGLARLEGKGELVAMVAQAGMAVG
jgi:hypothetical protein